MVELVRRLPQQSASIICVLVAMVCLSLQDAAMKWLSGDYPLHQAVLGRSLVALTIVLVLVSLTSGFSALRTRRLPLHLTRALLLVVANSCYFLALAAMPLAETMAIFFVAPLFTTLLSVPLLGERVGPVRVAAVAVGLAGVVVMLRPGAGVFAYAALLPLVAALCYALMVILTRRLGATDGVLSMVFYIQSTFLVTSVVVGLTIGDGRFYGRFAGGGDASLEFLFRAWRLPAGEDLAIFGLCGVLIAIAAMALSQGYRLGEATLLAPFEYAALPLAVVWGFLLWGELPDRVAWLGIAMIVGAGLLVFYREGLRGRAVASSRPLPRNR